MLSKILKNYKNSYKSFVPYEILIDEGIVLNKTNSFMSCFRVRFNDLDYLEVEDYETILNRINQAIRRLPDGYSIHFEVQRNKSNEYPAKDLNDKPYPTRIIERLRENSVKKEEFYITEYFISVTYTMKPDVVSYLDKFINFFKTFKLRKSKEIEKSKEELLKEFKKELTEFKNTVELFVTQYRTAAISVDQLTDRELLGFLYTAVNNEKRETVGVPPIGSMYIDELITASTLTNEDDEKPAKIMNDYIKAITINLYPGKTYPRIFNELENLNFEYRFVTRFIVLTREEALDILKKARIYFNFKLKSLIQWIIDGINQRETTSIDTNQLEKINEADEIEMELKSGEASLGYYTFTFLIKDKDLESLDRKVQEVRKVLSVLDFVANEDKYNTFDSIFGSIPGNIVANIRKVPMSSKSVATLMPMSSLYVGDKYNRHLKDIALFTTKTEKELFYFNLHNGDVGHTSLIGPTGYGKSFLLNFLATEFGKYEYQKLMENEQGQPEYITKKAQVFFFDVGGSSRVLCELNGGKFYDLGKDDEETNEMEVSFQPLANIDDDKEKEWALSWISILLEQEGINVDARVRTILWEAIKSLASSDIKRESRTLSNYCAYIQSRNIREALSIYCGTEAYAKYFDSSKEEMEENNFIVFEMNNVITNEKVIVPLLDYIFHKIERDKLDGTPTLIIVDEFQVLVKNEKMKEKIEKWLNTLRKYNASVILSTQSLKHLSESSIAASIIDACKTNIYLPNERAMSTWRDLYHRFNLNDKEIEEIRNGLKKMDYFVKRTDGTRLFQLNSTATEISLVGSSDKNDQKKIIQLKKMLDEIPMSEEKRILQLNKEWINYKYKMNQIPLYEIEQYKDILLGGD
ncbi:transporter [Leptotrichia sp. OH3620_COT-345]|uniref:VirB4 family type IV secretion/conjugal transfer ATPase n=1 Tax=Leptotrichia sp. OH3620_COT-345 TaxID=2491048 RepID=UPI000F64557F|nr:TraM recognition domain-containing protein [Leptotrichia sp. OH3620_COT-345]RRD40361.1 transporter [Leptotrichia sp. OH3620_COT-345]